MSKKTAAFGALLAGVDASASPRAARWRRCRCCASRAAGAPEAQRAQDPFGGFSAIGWRNLRGRRGAKRVFQSPGPIYEPEGAAADYWRLAAPCMPRVSRAGDLIHNSFSYHLTPAGSMMETGAHAIGCTVFAGGVGNTELQAAGDAGAATARLRRHAQLPAHPLQKAAEAASPCPR